MKARYLLMVTLLAGCTNQPYFFEGPEFEWVEPIIFQHNLNICRSLDTCRAETLFDG